MQLISCCFQLYIQAAADLGTKLLSCKFLYRKASIIDRHLLYMYFSGIHQRIKPQPLQIFYFSPGQRKSHLSVGNGAFQCIICFPLSIFIIIIESRNSLDFIGIFHFHFKWLIAGRKYCKKYNESHINKQHWKVCKRKIDKQYIAKCLLLFSNSFRRRSFLHSYYSPFSKISCTIIAYILKNKKHIHQYKRLYLSICRYSRFKFIPYSFSFLITDQTVFCIVPFFLLVFLILHFSLWI